MRDKPSKRSPGAGHWAAAVIAACGAHAALLPSVRAEPPALAVPLPEACATASGVLGLSRIVEVDATGGPRFGQSQFKDQDFLAPGEIVLTFDDGPAHKHTRDILDALDAQCTRATFFAVGRMALADPGTLKETARRGHTVGTHTFSHAKLTDAPAAKAQDEFELGLSVVAKAIGAPPAPFFRFPYLGNSRSLLAHLATRNQAVFSIDVDSRDFSTRDTKIIVQNVLSQLATAKKGIILFHDLQATTAKSMPRLLATLAERGYKVVHLVPKAASMTLPAYDAKAAKLMVRGPVAVSGHEKPITGGDSLYENENADAVSVNAKGQEPLPWSKAGPAEAGAPSEAGKVVKKNEAPKTRPPAFPEDDNPWQLRSLGRD